MNTQVTVDAQDGLVTFSFKKLPPSRRLGLHPEQAEELAAMLVGYADKARRQLLHLSTETLKEKKSQTWLTTLCRSPAS